ncbi:hypothetical protein EHS25_008575 [Saitozyma podzolica]|uniref:Major facilitator superfamily (MFS) profile domain-containing protein n=1 Tax=Saitozyma podzolica TaxID=1890683 RepID=A0A427YM75_9TREE|nr:hypothetical protein EHS25_008575 [Saitozyma podzolica]
MTAFSTSAYSIGIPSMMADLGMTDLQALAGVGLYAFGFGIAPLVLAPLSEEFGRKWTYIVAIAIFTILHVMIALAKNIETVLINRILMGAAGSIGATLVGGTISDIYVPAERGMPMTVFAFCAMFGTGIGPVIMSWVEANPKLQWRWIQWIQLILMGAYFPTVFLALKETRASVILRRKARRLRKERGDKDGGRYTARSEVEKVSFAVAMRQSLLRPLTFLVVEPVVIFFSAWISVGWGVLYTQIGGLPYIFENIYGFNVTQSGLAYITLCVGSFVALGGSLIQDSIYRRKVAKRGIEARLYAPMVAGVTLAIGCFWYGFSSTPTVHWIVPCIGLVIVIASILTIYITAFVYLSECYGSYASSAIAAQSFARNMIGGSFSFFTIDMYDNLTPRWAIFLMGCIALLLAIVPFAAFWRGPQIRARSRYSKLLMEEEKRRVAAVQVGGEEAGGEDVEIMKSSTWVKDNINALASARVRDQHISSWILIPGAVWIHPVTSNDFGLASTNIVTEDIGRVPSVKDEGYRDPSA